MSEWKTMKSAPKDGSPILLAEEGVRTVAGQWIKPNGFNPLVSMLAGEEGGYWCFLGSAMKIKAPTAWRKMPPPPVLGMKE